MINIYPTSCSVHPRALSRAPPRGSCTPGWEPLIYIYTIKTRIKYIYIYIYIRAASLVIAERQANATRPPCLPFGRTILHTISLLGPRLIYSSKEP